MIEEFRRDKINDLIKKYNLFVKQNSFQYKFNFYIDFYKNIFANISQFTNDRKLSFKRSHIFVISLLNGFFFKSRFMGVPYYRYFDTFSVNLAW